MSAKLQKHNDGGWENLNSEGTIRGRIINGYATIIVYGHKLTVNAANTPYQILALQPKYVPTRSIPFALFRELSNSEPVSGLIVSDSSPRIRVYSNSTGEFSLYGSVSYPI